MKQEHITPVLPYLDTPQYNNTVVTCIITFGPMYGTKNATLRIQGIISMVITSSLFLLTYLALSLSLSGKLSEVGNLTYTRQSYYYINCSWSPPFSLDGVPIYGYIINVTNEGDNTKYTTTSNTTSWIYCPSQFGYYTISIAGNNSDGEGEISITSVTLPTGIISGM